MLNIGFGEILLIAVLLLVVVGPERLPGLLRVAGRQYAKLRRAANELQHAFMDEGDLLDGELRAAQRARRGSASQALVQKPGSARSAAPPDPTPAVEPSSDPPPAEPAEPAQDAGPVDVARLPVDETQGDY